MFFGGRQKELNPKRIVKTIASQAPTTSKKSENLTPLVATRERRKITNGFSFRSNERAEKKKQVYRDNISLCLLCSKFTVEFLAYKGLTFSDAAGKGGSCSE